MNLWKKTSLKVFGGVIIIFLLSINSLQNHQQSTASNTNKLKLTYDNRPWPTSNWTISTLIDQGMDPTKIHALKEYISTRNYNIESMLIVKNGYLVLEEYFGIDLRQFLPHAIYSCTKSVMSTLIGIAIDQGYLVLNQTLLEFFPNRTINYLDSRKQNITIEHLLSMTDGFNWNEWYISYNDPSSSYYQMANQVDWVQYVLDQPIINDPGSSFNYNTGVSHLLSAILEVATGNKTKDYAKHYLFDPLNITDFTWSTDPTGLTRGGEGLFLTARDMAKLGYLYLNDGMWNSSQLVSHEWIIQASTKQTATYVTNYDYGYQWWVRDQYFSIQHFSALGYLGQRIFIIPEKDLVVVFTSTESSFDIHLTFLEDYIIPATLTSPETTTGQINSTSSVVSTTSYQSKFSSFSYFTFILGSLTVLLSRKRKRSI